jgi:hypothetical protein
MMAGARSGMRCRSWLRWGSGVMGPEEGDDPPDPVLWVELEIVEAFDREPEVAAHCADPGRGLSSPGESGDVVVQVWGAGDVEGCSREHDGEVEDEIRQSVESLHDVRQGSDVGAVRRPALCELGADARSAWSG